MPPRQADCPDLASVLDGAPCSYVHQGPVGQEDVADLDAPQVQRRPDQISVHEEAAQLVHDVLVLGRLVQVFRPGRQGDG
jgi:hypothetical protein